MKSIRKLRLHWPDGITLVGVVTGIAAATSVLLQHLDVIQGTASPEETIATAILALGGLLAALGGQYAKVWADAQQLARDISGLTPPDADPDQDLRV